MARWLFWLGIGLLLPLQLMAQSARPIDPLSDAIRLRELLEVMEAESLHYGAELDAEFLQGRGGAGWARQMARIHDADRWEARLRARLEGDLPAAARAPALAYLSSDGAQKIIALELSARRALLDPAVDAASQEHLARLRRTKAALLDQIARFVAVNDLIEANVVGALNSNIAFLEGFHAGSDTPSGDLIGDVWAQEGEIRQSTIDWLYGFLAMAYAPLAPAELDAYIAFSESPAGQGFNAALFAAFDEMFIATAHATGLALGRMMGAEDI